jgi:hypothetical protein
MWGWYDTEYETDQLAGMYVNAKVLKSHYTELRKGALSVYPVEYWSEMEAHHLNNIYSMYVASRLLWDLDQDPQAVLQELTDAVWGPKNGVMVLRALGLIEDMRSGPTWSTYWWPRPEHRVGTADPQDDFRRADQALTELKAMKPDDSFVPKIPLPFPPETFVELMIPHLMQIRQFAQFRLDVEAIRKAAGDGASKETLEKMAAEAWKPVPEYNTWIGTFGTKEIREQKRIMADLAKKSSLTIQPPPWFRAWEAHRGLELLRTMQSRFEAPVAVSPDSFQEFYWSDADRADRFRKLVEEGSVVQIDGVYHLADWSDWASRD